MSINADLVQVSECNAVCARVTAEQLGVTSRTLADDVDIQLNTVVVKAGKPVKGELKAQLSAQSATFYLARHAVGVDPDFTPGADCVTVSRVDSTELAVLQLDTTLAKHCLTGRIVEDDAGGAGATLLKLGMLISEVFDQSRGGHEIAGGLTALKPGSVAAYDDTIPA